ncbi:MAG: hypothetical protein IBJ03_13525 [Gemmatimonadaceae bacterium]|nr:hypothetical protein [Gemmatimonadaceae bacterium]
MLISWVAALAVGVLAAWLAYGRSRGAAGEAARPRVLLLALIRGAAVTLVAALLFGAPSGRATPREPLIAIDRSASWRRAMGDDSAFVRAWRSAVRDSLSRVATDAPVIAIGDSLRDVSRDEIGSWVPDDAASRVRPAVDRAASLGRSLVLVTDGEVDDAEVLAEAPPGSRAVRLASTPRQDVGIAELTVPGSITAGDTLEAAITLASGGVATADGTLQLLVDGRVVATSPVPAMAPHASSRISMRVNAPAAAAAGGVALIQAALSVAGDAESRNDTLGVAVDVGDRPSAVFVSTAPDLDVREVLTVLRGALDVPTRAYLRVAPGLWRVEGSLAPIAEDEVRARAASAGMLIVHGDTAWRPSAAPAAKGALARALWVPAPPTATARAGEITRTPEWYVAGVPASPLQAALAGLPFDSLPPITLASPIRIGTPVLTAQLGKRGDAAAAVAVRESDGQRTVLVSGSGWAGWALRAGRSREAFGALWGAIFDWLSAGRGDVRAARPVAGMVRAGEPILWRRGGTDTVVQVALRRRTSSANANTNAEAGGAASGAGDSLTLRFSGERFETVSPALPVGVYDVEANGGRSVLVVNASREWVPRAPTIASGPLARGAAGSDAPRLADKGWPFVAALLLLCAEWLVRRASGQR